MDEKSETIVEPKNSLYYGCLKGYELSLIAINSHVLILSFLAYLLVQGSFFVFLMMVLAGSYVAKTPGIFFDAEDASKSEGLPVVYLWVTYFFIGFGLICSLSAATIAFNNDSPYFWYILVLPLYNLLMIPYIIFLLKTQRLKLDKSIDESDDDLEDE